MNQPSQHPDAEVRQALAGAIQAYGVAVLGNAQMLGNILTDLLPDHPRERSLLVVAAEAETAAQLREAVEGQRLDIGTAVDLTSRTLAERRALDPVAARWATAAFAQALGHNPPPAPPADVHQADTVRVPQQGVNPDAPTAVGAPPPAPTVPQPDPQQAAPQAPQGFGPPSVPVPGAAAAPPPPAGPPAGFGPPMPQGGYGSSLPPNQPPAYGSSIPNQAGPPAYGYPQQGYGYPPGYPAGAPPRRRPVGLIIAGAAVAFVVVAYFAIAGAAKLPPFSASPKPTVTLTNSPSPSPSPSDSPSPSPTDSPSDTPSPSDSPSNSLLADGTHPLVDLLPRSIDDPDTECGSFTVNKDQHFVGLIDYTSCTDTSLPKGNVWGYKFDNKADFQTSWANYNKWLGFDTSGAEGKCPPSKSTHDGRTTWWNDSVGLPKSTSQIEECTMVKDPTTGKTMAKYVWSMPSQLAFFSAEGAPGQSSASVHTWFLDNASPHSLS